MSTLNLNGKRVLVVGLGKSGVASALFLKKQGAKVSVSDAKPPEQLGAEIPMLLDQGIAVETGGHGERTFREQDLIVVSPGVPLDAPLLVQMRALGEEVIGEIELAATFLPHGATVIAITGSNGKTTTTTLTGEIFAAAGLATLVGGNIGTPAISLVPHAKPESMIVLEISSFQLETVKTFRPKIAAVLNITPDHLDRHHTLQAYVNAKARIFENQAAEDYVILNQDDHACRELAGRAKSQVFWFSRKKEVSQGAFLSEGRVLYRDARGLREVMLVAEIPLKGGHNAENVLAAVCAAMIEGIDPATIRAAVQAFKAVEHRLEYVATIQGVAYYNDSKATNVDATIKALESFPSNIHLILGGKDKGSDYSVLNDLLRTRVKRVYTLGAAAAKIEAQIRGAVEIFHAETLENAVTSAAARAQSGDIVLLAPACASFDQFQSYEHRGRVFKETVSALAAAAFPQENQESQILQSQQR